MGDDTRNPDLSASKPLEEWITKIHTQIIIVLQSESYIISIDVSMKICFLKWATHARYLEEPRGHQWIIGQLKWHLSQRAYDRLEILQPATIRKTTGIMGGLGGTTFMKINLLEITNQTGWIQGPWNKNRYQSQMPANLHPVQQIQNLQLQEKKSDNQDGWTDTYVEIPVKPRRRKAQNTCRNSYVIRLFNLSANGLVHL